jgi:hypothetical protein
MKGGFGIIQKGLKKGFIACWLSFWVIPVFLTASFAADKPQVISVTPAPGSFVKPPLSSVSAKLKDFSGKGIDLILSEIKVSGPKGPVIGRPSDNGVDTIYWNFSRPLATNGEEDGIYTITVIPVDKAGNVGDTYVSTFTYDSQVPMLLSSFPKEGEVLRAPISSLSVSLLDKEGGSGVNLSATSVTLVDPSGTTVPSQATNDGIGTVTLSFEPIAKEGIYTIRVVPEDIVGNRASLPISIRFYYAVTPPSVSSSQPPDKGFIRSMPKQISVVLKDESNCGLDLTRSTLKLFDPAGNEIDGELSTSGTNTLVFSPMRSFAADGTDDGRYVISVAAYDKTGLYSNIVLSFLYDTRVPEVIGVKPEDGAVVRERVGLVVEVDVRDEGSGVDFEKSVIKVYGPDGKEVAGNREDDGRSKIRLRIAALPLEGSYRVQVIPADKAGNVAGGGYIYGFVHSFTPPEVTSVSPGGGGYVKGPLMQVVIKVKDMSGLGIDREGSWVKVKGPGGEEVGGLGKWGVDGVVYEFTRPLAMDGSVDGRYEVIGEVKDKAGNVRGISDWFIYDTKAPEVIRVYPGDGDVLSGKVEYVEVEVRDDGIGVDPVGTKVQVYDPNGALVSGNSVWDGGRIRVSVSVGVDGVYQVKVSPVDRLGNGLVVPLVYKFGYTTTLPVVLRTWPENGGKVCGPLSEVWAELKDVSGKGLDLGPLGSTIRLVGPSGVDVSGVQEDDGVSVIRWRLNKPLGVDGRDDGSYQVVVVPVDKAGNRGTQIRASFIYDTVPPRVQSVTPSDGSYVKGGLKGVTVVFEEGGSGIDFGRSWVKVEGPYGEVKGKKRDDGKGTIWYDFSESLAYDGSMDGVYHVKVEGYDLAGNGSGAYEWSFLYDTRVPEVIGVKPEDGAVVRERVGLVVEVDVRDEGSGVDFEKSVIKVYGPDGKEVVGNREDDGRSKIRLRIAALPLEGSYRVQVIPADKAGNVAGGGYIYGFVHSFTPPEVTSVSPGGGGYVKGPLMQVVIKVKDMSGLGIDREGSWVKVKGPGGEEVGGLGKWGVDGVVYEFTRPLAMDGSVDGRYEVIGEVKDKAGNVRGISDWFIYDTKAPEVIRVYPGDGDVLSGKVEYVEVEVRDDGIGVDPVGTKVQVYDPNGALVSGNSVWDGGRIRVSVSVGVDGVYQVKVSPVDRLGNGLVVPLVYKFGYTTTLPVVLRTWPENGGKVCGPLSEVWAELKDVSGKGLDLGPLGSTIRLVGPSGVDVSGVQEDDGVSVIRWRLNKPLGVDGRDDGSYQVVVVPVDKAGNRGTQIRASFIYDTVPPRVQSVTPSDGSYVKGGLKGVTVVFEEGGSGIDFGRSWVKVEGPYGEVKGKKRDDGKGTIWYDFSESLAYDGSMDGVYHVKVEGYDLAGNGSGVYEWSFLYDTRVPEVIGVKPEDGAVVRERVGLVVEVDVRDEGSGVDFEKSVIKVYGPDGKEVVGNREDDGRSKIRLRIAALPLEGSYRVQVMPADKAGNVAGAPIYVGSFMLALSSMPSFMSLIPAPNSFVGSQISQVSLSFKDQSGISGMDLNDWSISLHGPEGAVEGRVVNNGRDTVTFLLSEPLPMDGSRDGIYRIIVERKGTRLFEFSFLYDTIPPKVISVEPEDGSWIGPSTTEIRAKLSDDGGSGLDLLRSSIKMFDSRGNPVEGTISNDGKDTIIFSFPSIRSEGKYTVRIQPVDKAGNGAGAASSSVLVISLNVDATAPTATLDWPPDGSKFKKAPIRVSGTSSDQSGGMGMALVEVGVTYPDGTVVWYKAKDESRSGDWSSWSFNFYPSGDGKYKIEARAKDKGGNVFRTSPISIDFEGGLDFAEKPYSWPSPVVGSEVHVSYRLTMQARVKMKVFTVDGKLLYESPEQDSPLGTGEFVWDCRNSSGEPVARGIYIYVLEARSGTKKATSYGRMVIIRR